MSHFSVAVFMREEPTNDLLERMLEPFWEGDGSQDENTPYFEFVDETDENKEKYENETRIMIKCPDGELVSPWDERFRVEGTIGGGAGTHKVPEGQGHEQVEVPFKDLYPSFEHFMEDYVCLSQRENGRYGYYRNPNAKWDWYDIGGRWRNRLKVKENCDKYIYPAEGNAVKAGWADCCHVSCIDFEAMKEERLKNLTPMSELFKHYRESYIKECYPTEAEYIERETMFKTYAVLTPDGEWLAPGEMGWWGFSSDTPDDKKEWDRNYHKFFEQFADCYITVVDCHI